MEVSLVIPAYNEQTRLTNTLEQYSQCLDTCYRDAYEIIVVANGCTDQTAQVAREFSFRCPQVKVIDIPEAIGKGGAVLEGFRQASGKWIVFADADCATAPGSLIDLIEQLKDTDIVIGSRWLPSSRVIQKQPILRQVFSRLFNLSVRLLFDLPYKDTQCGAKAFRAAPAVTLSKLVKEGKWTFDVDLLLWAKICNFSVKEAPVLWKDQSGSKLQFKSTSREVVTSLWKLKQNNKTKEIYVKSSRSEHQKAQL